MKFPQALFCVVAASMVSGCFRPSFEPVGVSLPSNVSQRACVDANAKREPLDSLRALAHATISSDSERASFRYVVLSKEPSSFRVDVLPENGAFTLGLLVARDGKALWLDAQERVYAENSDERRLIAEYLGLRGVSREAAVALMTGSLPQLSCQHVRLYELPDGDHLFVDDNARIAWRTKGDSTDLISLQVLDEQGSSVEMEGRFSPAQGGSEPGVALEVFAPARARVEISLARLTRNPKLSEHLFEVQPPHDYKRIE